MTKEERKIKKEESLIQIESFIKGMTVRIEELKLRQESEIKELQQELDRLNISKEAFELLKP